MVMGPISSFSIAVSDMSDTRHSVVVDMIMVQVFSLVLGLMAQVIRVWVQKLRHNSLRYSSMITQK